jgi:lipopolysaccharide O-acetyltransferase
MVIGDDVFVGPGSWLQVLDENGADVAIEIGHGTSIAGGCVISAASSVRLGRKVLIARNVYISDHIHAYDDTTRAVLDQGVTRIEAVEIGDGAWLGENVVVCPGVSVGRGAVVGANAVVTDDVPDYSLAVGAPARIVRSFAPPMELAS